MSVPGYIYPMLDALNSRFSTAKYYQDKDGKGTIEVVFEENGKIVLLVRFKGITPSNREACQFIAYDIMAILSDVYKNTDREDSKHIISTSGFIDACEGEISRNSEVAKKSGLKIELKH